MLIIFLLNIFHLSSDTIYSIDVDLQGQIHPGRPVLTLSSDENPVLTLVKHLQFGDYHVRKLDKLNYISALSGEGYIPVLSFHRLGDKQNFELDKQLFEELLIYLKNNGFHIINDHQYFEEDYTYAENGRKIIVMGSDDGAKGVFYYKTHGDLKEGTFLVNKDNFIISDESMVYYLDKYLEEENGKKNFTFYITFDAIPFRQTGGEGNPGPPYLNMPAVKAKLDYLNNHYIIGNHTASHLYSEDLEEDDFIKEITDFYRIMEDYSVDINSMTTLAYSFGIGELSEERENTVKSFDYKGVSLEGAFDYNGYFSHPLSSGNINPFDVPRIGVDNKSFSKIMTLLKNVDIFQSRRVVLIEGDDYPFGLTELQINKNDSNYILIRN